VEQAQTVPHHNSLESVTCSANPPSSSSSSSSLFNDALSATDYTASIRPSHQCKADLSSLQQMLNAYYKNKNCNWGVKSKNSTCHKKYFCRTV